MTPCWGKEFTLLYIKRYLLNHTEHDKLCDTSERKKQSETRNYITYL